MKRKLLFTLLVLVFLPAVAYGTEVSRFFDSEQCLGCHSRHDGKVAHDVHLGVSCAACHLSGATPVRDPETLQIVPGIDAGADEPDDVHDMLLSDVEHSCVRCHHKANRLGASALVLPAKSVICMPCHAATFSVGDTTTIVSLLLFLAGVAGLATVWLSGVWCSGKTAAAANASPGLEPRLTSSGLSESIDSRSNAQGGNGRGRAKDSSPRSIPWRPISPSRIVRVLVTLALDIFLQRRLFKQSRTRWIIHGLIFFPFLFRFLWGITALFTSLRMPESSLPWTLLDRNNPLTAFVLDLSGVSILLGVILAALRGIVSRSRQVPFLPKPDWVALLLIGGTVLIGFVLEGIRIAMTGSPGGSELAFLGYGISRFFVHTEGLPNIFGVIWYLHAIATGAFIAYLPFSRLFHIIMAPVVLAINAVFEAREHGVVEPVPFTRNKGG